MTTLSWAVKFKSWVCRIGFVIWPCVSVPVFTKETFAKNQNKSLIKTNPWPK